MNNIFVVTIIIGAIVVIVILVSKLNTLQAELNALQARINQEVMAQVEVWKRNECEQVRQQQLDIARREAAVALQSWKAESEISIRNDAVQRSQAVIIGKVTEHVVPYLPEFRFNPKDARFIGSPIDLVVFDGLDQEMLKEIVFIEVKTNISTLTKRERQVRDAILAGRVGWRELRVERANSAIPPLLHSADV